jgi:hypothetical protein
MIQESRRIAHEGQVAWELKMKCSGYFEFSFLFPAKLLHKASWLSWSGSSHFFSFAPRCLPGCRLYTRNGDSLSTAAWAAQKYPEAVFPSLCEAVLLSLMSTVQYRG